MDLQAVVGSAIVSKVSPSVTRAIGLTGARLSKNSPAILTFGGIGAMVASTVMIAKAHTHAGEILDELEKDMASLERAEELTKKLGREDEYPEAAKAQDKTKVVLRAGARFARLYGPGIVVGVGGIVSILVGHRILHQRNLALVAAYKAIDESFKSYRERVTEELGEDRELRLAQAVKEESYEDANGKKKKRLVQDKEGVSRYARFFDEYAEGYQDNNEYNLAFLKTVERRMNEKLVYRGHVLLNDVYDALGLNRTKEGCVVGWVFNDSRQGTDSFIDFGLTDSRESVRRFLSGNENSVLLDFNVSGVVYDLL